MTQQPEYSHARHMARVQAAARQAGIKGAAFAVLAYLCASADFKRPEVLRSKDNIVERTGYGIAAVKAALATLRAGGFLVPVAYATGGKHRATVYRIEPGKGYENDTPTAAKGVWKSSPKGYGKQPPFCGLSCISFRVERCPVPGRAECRAARRRGKPRPAPRKPRGRGTCALLP